MRKEAGVTDACWKHQSLSHRQTDLHLLKYGNLEDAAIGMGCPNPFALLAWTLFCTGLSSVLGQVDNAGFPEVSVLSPLTGVYIDTPKS